MVGGGGGGRRIGQPYEVIRRTPRDTNKMRRFHPPPPRRIGQPYEVIRRNHRDTNKMLRFHPPPPYKPPNPLNKLYDFSPLSIMRQNLL